jgi:flagellar hook-associated protein 3 FlgL
MEANREVMAGLQEKLSSTKSFQRVSDDPGAASAALTLRSSMRAGEAYLDTARSMDEWMSATDVALDQMEINATKAINLAQQGGTDTLSATERKAIAQQMDSLLQEVISLGNTDHQGSFLFAGFGVKMAPGDQPFTFVPGDPAAVPPVPDSVTYSGDNNSMNRSVGPGHTIALNVDAETPFQDLYTAMIDVRDALNADDGAASRAGIDTLNAALDKISDLRTQNGARQNQVKARISLLNETQLSLSSMLTNKEDVNMTEAITQLRYQETVYQAVLEVSRRSLATANLFEYLG